MSALDPLVFGPEGGARAEGAPTTRREPDQCLPSPSAAPAPAAGAATDATPTGTTAAARTAPSAPPTPAHGGARPVSAASSPASSPATDDRPVVDAAVVVCTWTSARWGVLLDALRGVAAQTVLPREVVLVVDHAPDVLALAGVDVPLVLADLDGRADVEVRVLASTGAKGLSGARNTGIAATTAPVVAFLDDDAVPEPTWLERMLAAYDETGAHAVGGGADPGWPTAAGRPAHLPRELDWVVGCSHRGLPEQRADVRNLLGASMSFRRDALEAAGPFREDAGRIGSLPLGAEETELCIRLDQAVGGARIVLEPTARVRHMVTEDRTTWRYLRRRAYAEGLSKAATRQQVGPAATATERAYLRRTVPAGLVREGWRAKAGLLLAVAAAGWGFVRGRLSPGSASAAHRDHAAADRVVP